MTHSVFIPSILISTIPLQVHVLKNLRYWWGWRGWT